jgi:hypothetical protein
MQDYDFLDHTLSGNSPAASFPEIQTILKTIISNNAGPNPPSTTFPFMWWPDTTNNRLKQRNATDDGWIDWGPLETAFASIAGGGDANFVTMPQVGGNPIVESGSNSDGEWTRWADGSQIVTATQVLYYHNSSNLKKLWTYPASFVSGSLPRVTFEITELDASIDKDNMVDVWYRQIDLVQNMTKNNTDGGLIISGGGFPNGDEQQEVDVMAIGRWL